MQKQIKFVYALFIIVIIGVGASLFILKISKNIIAQDYINIINTTKKSTINTNVDIGFVHPFCFGTDSRFVNEDSREINIDECNKKAEEYKYEKDEDRFIMASYPPYKDEDFSSAGWVGYDILGSIDNLIVVSVVENTGGSGNFTWISFYKKDGNILRFIKSGNMGDRCNGGILKTELKNGGVDISSYVTPIDIVDLTYPDKLEACEDLEASATSCFGYLTYHYNLYEDKSDFISVSFATNEDPESIISDQEGWTENYKYQSCFNEVYKRYILKNKLDFSKSELDLFNKEFVDSCVK